MADVVRTVRTLDRESGEVNDYAEDALATLTDPTMVAIASGTLPLYLQELEKKNLSPEDAEEQLSLFTGVEPVSFNEFLNKKVKILGCIAHPHGPFTQKDGSYNPGYWQVLLLTDEKDRNGLNVVIGCSGVTVMPHMGYAIQKYGWYLWEKSQEYLLTKGSKSGAFFMRNVSRPPTTDKHVNHKA